MQLGDLVGMSSASVLPPHVFFATVRPISLSTANLSGKGVTSRAFLGIASAYEDCKCALLASENLPERPDGRLGCAVYVTRFSKVNEIC